jgi:NTE family protein/lysophospholipid hydrolase
MAGAEFRADEGSARAALIRTLPILASLPESVVRALAAHGTEVVLAAGDILIRQGEVGDAMYLLTEGRLTVTVTGSTGERSRLAVLEAPETVGEMQAILGGNRTADVHALTDCRLLRLPHAPLRALDDRAPQHLEQLMAQVATRLRELLLTSTLTSLLGATEEQIRQVVALADWRSLKDGDTLFQQGDAADAWYLVTSGRLQVLRTAGEGRTVVGEVGRGDSLGEASLLTGEPRDATVRAVRDTELIRLSGTAFMQLLEAHPALLLRVARTLVQRARRDVTPAHRPPEIIAVVPGQPGLSVYHLARGLADELGILGRTLHVTTDRLRQWGVCTDVADMTAHHPGWLRFSTWVEERLLECDYLLLEADSHDSEWTRRCVATADEVVEVIETRRPRTAAPPASEARLTASHTQRTLMLVHPAATVVPAHTGEWLRLHPVSRHFHVREDRPGDLGRVARLLARRGVGLVLGGGGARGFAHLGVLKACEERGLAVDCLSGTSMGAIMACQYAMGLSMEDLMRLNHRMVDVRPFTEYTVPIISLVAGHRAERAFLETFGETTMEDLWIPCVAVSANITTSSLVVHDRGLVRRAARASSALPGILPPVVEGAHLLVDGGVVNNLPADIVRQRWGGTVIAVNVSTKEDLAVSSTGLPGPWPLLLSRVMPGRAPLQSPLITEIVMRTMMLGSYAHTERMLRDADLAICPEVDRFGLLEFESLEAIADVGYQTGSIALAAAGATRTRT